MRDTKDITIHDEFSTLRKVIIGLGSPYQRDKAKVAREIQEFPLIPNTDRKQEVLDLTYPSEEILDREYAEYVAILEKYGVEVLRCDPSAAYSFDYTCPRDIGFVIGDSFYISNMSVASRAEEFKTILMHLDSLEARQIIRPPQEAIIEGGDVILFDEKTVLVGIHQRSNQNGFEFLEHRLAPLGYVVVPVYHSQLHLDCCLKPLGLGHLLIHPESLADNPESTWQILKKLEWIQVDSIEREHLATNLLSIRADTIIARDHPVCARVNQKLKDLGYIVEETAFDGVPATGGSFRCASLVLLRQS